MLEMNFVLLRQIVYVASVADPKCQICGFADESVDHIFTSCYVASVVWQGISQWCKVPNKGGAMARHRRVLAPLKFGPLLYSF